MCARRIEGQREKKGRQNLRRPVSGKAWGDQDLIHILKNKRLEIYHVNINPIYSEQSECETFDIVNPA